MVSAIESTRNHTRDEWCHSYFFPNFMYYPRDILLSRRDYKSKKKIWFINLMAPNVNLTINILYHTFFNQNSKLGYLCEP